MDAGLLEIYGSDHNGVVFKNYDNAFELKLLTRSNQLRSISIRLPIDLPSTKAMLTIDSIGNIDFENIPTSIDLSNYLKTDGSVSLDATYTPTADQAIATKKYVDDKTAGIGQGGTVDLSNYYTKAQSDTNFATKQSLTGYLTNTDASTLYALKSELPDLSRYLTASNAAGTYQTISGMSGYLTVSNAASTYQPISGMSGYQTASPALQALASTWASDTSQNNLIPQRSGSTIRWVSLPDTSGFVTSAQLTGLLKADGSVPISATFTPTNDHDLVYKAWVEQKIQAASIGSGNGGTAPDLSTYLLKTEAASLYQPIGASLTALQSSWVSTATDNMKIPQRQGNSIVWINLPDLSGYITEAAADLKYEPSNVTLKKLVTWWSTAQANEFPVKDTGTDRWVSRTLPDLSGYITSAQVQTNFLSKTEAATNYLSKGEAASTYLVASNAAVTYQSISGMTRYLTVNDAATTYAPLSEFNSVKNSTEGFWINPSPTLNLEDRQYTNADLDALKVGFTYSVPEETATDPIDSKSKLRAKLNVLFGITPPVWINQARLIKLSRQVYLLTCRTNQSDYLVSQFSTINYIYERGWGFVASSPIGGSDVLSRFTLVGSWLKYLSDIAYQPKGSALSALQASWASDTSQEGKIPQRLGNAISWVAMPTGGTGSGGTIDLTPYLTKTEASTTYALKSQIPDVTGFYTKSEADSKFFVKASYPELEAFATSSQNATNGYIPRKVGNGFNWVALPTTPDLTAYLTVSNAATTYAPLVPLSALITSPGSVVALDDRAYTAGDFRSFLIGQTYGVPTSQVVDTDPAVNAPRPKAKLLELFNLTPPIWIEDARVIRLTSQLFFLRCRTKSDDTLKAINYWLYLAPIAQASDGIGRAWYATFRIEADWLNSKVDMSLNVLQQSIPNMANYFTKTEANAMFATNAALNPINARTAYLDAPVMVDLGAGAQTIANMRSMHIGDTYRVPNGNVLTAFQVKLPATATEAYVQRLTKDSYVLDVNLSSGAKMEYLLTLHDGNSDTVTIGTGTGPVFKQIVTDQSASLTCLTGRFATSSTDFAGSAFGIVKTQNGRLFSMQVPCTVTIPQESTAPGSEDTVFDKDTEIGFFALGGAVTVTVAGSAQLNDAQANIVIPRYSLRVLKRFTTKDKWYLF